MMKRVFVTSLSLNANLEQARVNPVNFELNSTMEMSYNPIVPIMESVIEEGDEVKLIVIRQKTTNSSDNENMSHLKNELETIGLETTIIEEILLDEWQDKQVLMELFEGLINLFEDNAYYYADVTFGVKPYPIILITAFSYVNVVLRNTDIKGLYYQEIVRNENGKPIDSRLFDVSVMLAMSEMISFIGKAAPENASSLIHSLIHPKDGEE